MTRRKNRLPLSRKRMLAAMALLAYLAGAIGFPLPVSGRSAEAAAPLHVCGCAAPDRAARKCCCCCAPGDDLAPASCCGGGAHPAEPAGEVEVVWVAGLSAWRCQGLQPLLGEAGPSLTPPAPLAWAPGSLPLPWLRAESEFPSRLVLPLPEPPPRSFPGCA